MSAIKHLPSSSLWSILKKEEGFKLLSQPKAAWRLYKDSTENLLTGERLDYSGVTFLEDFLSRKKVTDVSLEQDELWVVHSFYELGFWWNSDGHLNKEKIPSDLCLGLIIDYQEEVPFDPRALEESDIEISWKSPNPLVYEKAFKKGHDRLMNGDCYQYNLTFPFQGRINNGSLAGLIKKLWSRPEDVGQYAHMTVCGDEFFVTNTPECLFDWRKERSDTSRLETRPIKGTVPLRDKECFDSAWRELSHSRKDESELFMITDLLRNDLNRIEKPVAKVLKKKAPLRVPGLLHSYSQIQVMLSGAVSLLSIMRSLFPGGSITGAPKIRVMQIIQEVESCARGFYCGSTLFATGGGIVGSINIRAAQGNIKSGILNYHAGGGITVQSSWESEYQEMENKFLSFQSLLTSP